MLKEAQRSLSARPEEALARLDQHRREFAGGQLSTERDVLVLEALQRAGRVAEARAFGEALLGRVAGTPYERRVRAVLGVLR